MGATLLHKAPFLRLLAAVAAGMVLQRYRPFAPDVLLCVSAASVCFILLYSFTGLRKRFRLAALNGVAFVLLLMSLGALLLWRQDVRNRPQWAGRLATGSEAVLVTVQEPLVEKANSYKALAQFGGVVKDGAVLPAEGNLLLYFRKGPSPPAVGYGSQLLFQKPLQAIKNAGNPGSFDYAAYCLYGGITHQVFLSENEYTVLPTTKQTAVGGLVFRTREWVVATLRRFIPGEKEQGLAEALLIGYKDDLDKNLVQAYSNTGVVHIIAISGLHLGLIYWLLMALTKPLGRNKKLAWMRLLIVVAALWAFTLLAGAQPSVLRSAVMFTVIAAGDGLLRRGNIFNTLAASALVLLCLNPFWLWDVGFQLSYSAVLSIVLFFRPVYNWFSFGNKAVDFFWKLTAVTIAAQVLTLPISVFHFHQLPLLFLFTNFVAVPLSSLILLGEIALCLLSVLAPVAAVVGKMLSTLIFWMNSYVERLDSLPFAVWNFLSISTVQTALLLVVALAGGFWLMEGQRRFAWLALSSLALFMVLRAVSFSKAAGQEKLVVYNVPKHTAIDLIAGRQYAFVGDAALLHNDYLRNFHLQPSRILHRTALTEAAEPRSFVFCGRQVVVVDETLALVSATPKPVVDLLVLSKKPAVTTEDLSNAFLLKQVVIDGSVPAWKAAQWQRGFDSLRIPCWNVAERGAFVLNF